MTSPPAVPTIDQADLVEELKRLMSTDRQHHLFAFHGTGEAVDLTIDASDPTLRRAGGVVRVVPCESELALRLELPLLDDPARPMAFLVPFAGQLPIDLQGRFARQGKVSTIGVEARLRRAFGVTEVDPETHRSTLARVVLRSGLERRLPEARLRLPRLWGLWLEHAFGLGLDGDWLGLDRLLGWAATNDQGPAFTALPEADSLRKELLGLVERDRHPLAEWIWRAWERRHGRQVLALALIAQAGGPKPSSWLRLRSKTLLDLPEVDDAILVGLGRLAEDGLRRFERQTSAAPEDRQRRREFLRWADGLVDDVEVRDALSGSKLLPLGFDARLRRLGEAFHALGHAPSSAALGEVLAAKKALNDHDQIDDVENDVLAKRIQMAVRLSFWLTTERADELGRADGHAEPAGSLGSWYVQTGGYLDWARRVARGGSEGPLDRGIDAVVSEVDVRRRDLDRRFAKALVAWVDGNRRTDLAIPIDQAAAHVIVPFLERWKDERLLVVLMDGMAWAQAVEILESLREEAWAWMPVAGHAPLEPQKPVFANLPTLTEISRSAFFAGKPMESHRTHATSEDGARFKAARALTSVTDPRFPPLLLLRAESHTRSGAASREALSAIEDVRHRIVGVVVNVIDDSLGGNPGHRIDWRVGTFGSLRSLFDAAREAGRTVLFMGDHGHVAGDRLEYRAPPGAVGGARWRPYREGEKLAEDEVLVRSKDDRVWCPRGADGVVLLADDEGRYTPASHAGEHGGATLSEVVTPCVLLRWHDPLGAAAGLRVAPLPAPRFWHDETLPEDEASTLRAAPQAPPARPPRGKARVPENQLVLLPAAQEPRDAAAPSSPAAPLKPATPDAHSPVAAALAKSEIFRARLPDASARESALTVVAYLAARTGTRAPKGALAARLQHPERTIIGMVGKLQTALNLDQYSVLDVVHESGEVVLDLPRLVELFELPAELRERGPR